MPSVRSDDRGFTLVGLLVVVAVINISFALAMKSWSTIDQRANEAELIWRGEQIARAIICYSGSDAGEPLERLEQLVEASCLRRLFPDPMTKSGEWRILRQSDLEDGTIAALLGQADEAEGDAEGGFGRNSEFGSGGSGIGSGLSILGGSSGSSTATGGSGGTASFGSGAGGRDRDRGGSGSPLGGSRGGSLLQSGFDGGGDIIGVMSKHTGETLRVYAEQDRYERWLFLSTGPPGVGDAEPGVQGPGGGAPDAPEPERGAGPSRRRGIE
jgi:type II secretory pathway pseudopilin PulG